MNITQSAYNTIREFVSGKSYRRKLDFEANGKYLTEQEGVRAVEIVTEANLLLMELDSLLRTAQSRKDTPPEA